jgi:hypothetical protein
MPYRFYGFDKSYGIDIACIPGHSLGCYLLPKDLVSANTDALHGGKVVTIGKPVRSSKCSVWNTGLKKWKNYCPLRMQKWHEEFEVHKEDVATGRKPLSQLKTELYLRMQCSRNSQLEIVLQMLLIRLNPTAQHAWPEYGQISIDRFVDGLRVQDKAVLPTPNCRFVGCPKKKVNSVQVPYASGDADLYVFSTIHERLRLLLAWTIPEAKMIEMGIVSTVSQDGSTSLRLLIPNECPQKSDIFGEATNEIGDEDWTSNHFSWHSLPDDFEIPDCAIGRDP